MPMGTVATLPNSAIAVGYMKKFMDWSIKTGEVFGPLVAWEPPIPEDGGGAQSFNFPAYGEVPPTSTPLPEMSDVTPEGIYDFNYTVTPYEYGRAFAVSQLARYQSRTTLQDKLARIAAQDRINSIDRIIRRKVYGHGSDSPSNTYLNTVAGTTMGTLAVGEVISWDFLTELVMQAQAMGIEPMDGSNFVSVIHPLLAKGLLTMADYKDVGKYSVPNHFYKGEIGMIAGIRFIVSNQAKVFWGAGPATTSPVSTTLSNAYNSGSTTIIVASGTGAAVGDYITIGTVETESVTPSANLEQVRVTSVNGTTLGIKGLGLWKPDSNNKTTGLFYDHAAGEAVVQAYNVCGIPILGKNSLIGVHGARTGRYGQSGLKTGLDILDRFGYVWWYWYGGVSRVDRYMVLGKSVVTSWTLGSN